MAFNMVAVQEMREFTQRIGTNVETQLMSENK
jgi:hypothetical protein